MISFASIQARAANRVGGLEALAGRMPQIHSAEALAAIPDDRWLSTISRCVFQAGFSWKVVENKWPGTEAAFWNFDPARCRAMDDEAFDALLKDSRIIRNGAKVRAVQNNAAFLMDLASEHGSAASVFAHWPQADFIGLLALLKSRGDRLGGGAGMMALRFMGRDGFVLSNDVTQALTHDGVISGPATSKTAMKAVQAAFDGWAEESGLPFAHISRTLACSIG